MFLHQVAAVSTVVNRGPPVKAYVFRNYTLPVGVRSHYRGGCRHKLWEAIRASSAAPGYFQEFALGDDLHQVISFDHLNTRLMFTSSRNTQSARAVWSLKHMIVNQQRWE